MWSRPEGIGALPAALRTGAAARLITRWYRAGAVAVLLLVPLVETVPAAHAWPVAALVLVLEARLGAPVPLALPTRTLSSETVLTQFEGPFAELPDVQPLGNPAVSADEISPSR